MESISGKVRRNVWILDDEPDCLFVASESLRSEFQIRAFASIQEIKAGLDIGPDPDALVADLKLGDGNFLDFLGTEGTAIASRFPIVIVSSLYESDTIRSSYAKGGLDYIVKPFHPGELLAKVEHSIEKFLNSRSRILSQQLDLTPKEGKLFECLYGAIPGPVTREHIVNAVWGRMRIHPKTVDVHIHNLRKKLRDSDWEIQSPFPGFWQVRSVDSENRVPPTAGTGG